MDDELKRYYRENLGPRIEALETAAAALPDPASAEAARRLAHTLKGSGGTYGFPEVTEVAARAEAAPAAELEAAIAALVEVLRRVSAGEGGEDADVDAASPAQGTARVLLVEDDADIRLLVERLLPAHGCRVLTAPTMMDARRVLADGPVAVVVLDLVLPDGDGRAFLRELREAPDTAALPVIILSAKTGPRTQTECFALGADDYFEKPFDPELLAASVASRIRRAADLERHGRRDELTGLPNRAAFRQAHDRLCGVPAAVALLDLDRFKDINDRFGHAIGDQALGEAARILRAALPAGVELARWGGEEFAALFPSTSTEVAKASLEAALTALREADVREPGGSALSMGFSAGIAEATGSLDDALARADHLLYVAKDQGRGLILAPGDEPEDAGATVLLCEDDAVTASLIKHRLGRERFDVRHFTDGLDAWKWARDDAPSVDLAILDVKMPGMDGFELLGRLRELEAFRGVPLLMLTSMGSERDVVRGFELGADDYIVKPFSPAELVARLHRHLRRP